MTESNAAGFTPPPTYSIAPTPQTTTAGSLRTTVPGWIKYASLAFLGLAGISWLFPQYEEIGVEAHDFLGGYTNHYFGSLGAGGGHIFIVWVFLLAAAASVWSIDQPHQPLGRFTWISIPLILLAMIFVGARQSDLAGTEWTPLEDLDWVKLSNDSTGAHAIVWVGLCAGLLGAASALIYTRFYKPTPRTATAATVVIGPGEHRVSPPPPPVEPQQPPVGPKSNLEQKLDEYDRLRADGKITDDEHAALRARALAGQ